MSGSGPARWRSLGPVPWLVVLGGVLVMLVLLVTATTYLSADRPIAGAPDPVWPFAPGASSAPEAPSAGSTGAPRTVAPTPPPSSPAARSSGAAPATPRGTRPPATPSTEPSTAAPAASPLTGRYRVLASYRDSFLAEVRLHNGSATEKPWTVELRFPPEVGRLRSYWVEAAPQPMLRRVGAAYVFTSTVALPAGASVSLRVNLDRYGSGDLPTECAVNGARCAIG